MCALSWTKIFASLEFLVVRFTVKMTAPAEIDWRQQQNLLDEDSEPASLSTKHAHVGSNSASVLAMISKKDKNSPSELASATTQASTDTQIKSSAPSKPHHLQYDKTSSMRTHQHDISSSPKQTPVSNASSRIVIAIDYGTTYTGLALARTKTNHANIDDIEVLQNWGPNGNNQSKVRSMISYVKSLTHGTQWGSAVDDHATAMVNTKLELEPQPTRFDELELTLYLLMGTGNLAFQHLKSIGDQPAYSSAAPQKVVQDYLSHICASAMQKGVFTKTDLSKANESKIPIDIVITVPAVCMKPNIETSIVC